MRGPKALVSFRCLTTQRTGSELFMKGAAHFSRPLTVGVSGRGLAFGSAGGLAVALLLLETAPYLSQSVTTMRITSNLQNQTISTVQSQANARPVMDNSTCPPEPVWIPPCFFRNPVSSTSSSSSLPTENLGSAVPAAASTSSLSSTGKIPTPAGTSGAKAGALPTMVSPFVGVLVAVTIYFAYVRRRKAPETKAQPTEKIRDTTRICRSAPAR